MVTYVTYKVEVLFNEKVSEVSLLTEIEDILDKKFEGNYRGSEILKITTITE